MTYEATIFFLLMQHSADVREQQLTTEEWAQRWLELSVMPSFTSQPNNINLGAKKDDLPGKQLSLHDYLSSPKVAVFNQVRSAHSFTPHYSYFICPKS